MKDQLPTDEQIDFVLIMLQRLKDGEAKIMGMKEILRFAGCLQLMAQAAEKGHWPKLT